MRIRFGVLAFVVIVTAAFAISIRATLNSYGPAESVGEVYYLPDSYSYPFGPGLFIPSNADTGSGLAVKPALFEGMERCVVCHAEVKRQWEMSLHRRSEVEPIYVAVVGKFEKELGLLGREASRFCAGCHSPVGLISGEFNPSTPLSDIARDSLSCVFCHSITQVKEEGVGRYVISPQKVDYLFFDSPNPILRKISEYLIKARPQPHREAMLKGLHKKAEFCGACHDVVNPFNGFVLEPTFREWQESSYNTGDPETTITCQDCHMTYGFKEYKANPGANTAGYRKKEHVFNHFFHGSNTAVPWYNDDKTLMDLNVKSLQAAAELEIIPPGAAAQGGEAEIEVKVTNSGAGHNLPTGAEDLREIWLSVQVTDVSGKELFRSGWVDQEGNVDEGAYRIGKVLGDAEGNPLKLHEVWRATQFLKKTSIPPKESSTVKYAFTLPPDAKGPLSVRAVLRFRDVSARFVREYFTGDSRFTKMVEEMDRAPIVDMAEAHTLIHLGRKEAPEDERS